MRSSEFHVEIAGVKYRLAEDAESEHYVHTREKTRPPNSQIVQGTSGGRFNSRPDLMVWSWTDWSDGEGQLKFDPTQPGRSRILQGVNFYTRPGNLFLGHYGYVTQDSTGAADFTTRVALVEGLGELVAVGVGTGEDDIYIWDGTKWGAAVSLGVTDGARREAAVCGDTNGIFFNLTGTGHIYKITDTSGTTTLWNNQLGGSIDQQLEEMGDYVYVFQKNGEVFEISKATANTTTTEVPIFDFSPTGGVDNITAVKIIAGDNRIYIAAVAGVETVIYEIVPSSAAGTGFGRELARIPGLIIHDLWWHGGFLWWVGIDQSAGTTGASRDVYYYQPGGAWGTIGGVRDYEQSQAISSVTQTGSGAVRLHTAAFALPPTHEGVTTAAARMGLFEVDAIKGGMGCTGLVPTAYTSGQATARQSIFHDGKFFVQAVDAGSTSNVLTWDIAKYTDETAYAISPDHDFGISTWKILHSIEIQTEPLPASTSVTVSYKLDDGSWVALAAHDTDNSGGTKWTISTGGSTKTFRYMALKVELDGTTTATPVVKGIDVRASVDEYVNLWHLLLDCTDESSPRGYSGATLVDHITALSDTTMFTFYDGYEQREFSVDLSYNVVVDNMAILLTKPGEGYVQVTLREVF